MGELLIGLGVAGGALKAKGMADAAVAENERIETERFATLQDLQTSRELRSIEEARVRRSSRRKLARNQARVGTTGIRGDEGSPLELAGRNAEEAERDALNVRVAGQIRERQLEQREKFLKTAQRERLDQAKLGVAAQLLGTATNAFAAKAKVDG